MIRDRHIWIHIPTGKLFKRYAVTPSFSKNLGVINQCEPLVRATNELQVYTEGKSYPKQGYTYKNRLVEKNFKIHSKI